MRRATIGLMLLAWLLGGLAQPLRAEVTAEQVRVAIDRSVAYLQRQQRADGSWSDLPLYPGGVTALCTLALLNAGVEPEEDSIQRALEHLRQARPEKTYVVALQAMVFSKATPKRDRSLVARNVAWLEKTQIADGATRGSWAYPGRSGDNSNSQFALLALYEADRIGVKVDGRTWRMAKGAEYRTYGFVFGIAPGEAFYRPLDHKDQGLGFRCIWEEPQYILPQSQNAIQGDP